MRIATLIISLCLALFVGNQAWTVSFGARLFGSRDLSDAGSAGLFVALLLAVGGAFALQRPRIARNVLAGAAVLALLIAASSAFSDMYIWAVAAGGLAWMAHAGQREPGVFAAAAPVGATGPATSVSALAPFATPGSTQDDGPIVLRPACSYPQALDALQRAMTELGGQLQPAPGAGVVDGRWRLGLNAKGLRVLASVFEDGRGLGVMIRHDVGQMPYGTGRTRRQAAAVAARFAEIAAGLEPAALPAADGPQPPRLVEGGCPHRGLSRRQAVLYAIIGGGVGLHRFYLGSWGWGLCYLGLLLLLPGSSVIVALAEAVRLWRMTPDAFDAAYNLRPATPLAV